MNMKKSFISIVFIFVFVLNCFCLSGCKKEKKEKFNDYSFNSFDTVTTITGFEVSKEKFDDNCKKIKEKLNHYHKLYDIYTKYDGINNLCYINEIKENVKVEKEIIELLTFSKEMYNKTYGKVNIAMGSVLSLWHYSREDGLNHPANAVLPDMEKLKDASKHTDINNLIIDSNNNIVTISDKVMSLDVGAIAKGYSVQKVAEWMKTEGMNGYILNVGGNVSVVGDRPDGNNWTIGIQNPNNENGPNPYIETLGLTSGKSLVTSGSYQRYYVVDGKEYHHIIDEETLMPSEYFKSVSVLCEDSGVADALSTALFCMDYEKGLEIIEATKNAEAMWVFNDGTQRFSKNFQSYLSK